MYQQRKVERYGHPFVPRAEESGAQTAEKRAVKPEFWSCAFRPIFGGMAELPLDVAIFFWPIRLEMFEDFVPMAGFLLLLKY